MKFNLCILLSGLVPILGLTSCTANHTNESQPNIVMVRDTSVLPPLMTTSSQGKRATSTVKAKGGRVDAEAELSFSTNDPEAFVPVALAIQSECKVSGTSRKSQMRLKNSNHFPAVGLLPTELFLELNWPDLSEVTCDLVIDARNANGSSRTLNISELAIENFSGLQNLAINSLNAKNEVVDSFFKSDPAKAADLVLNLPLPSTAKAMFEPSPVGLEKPTEHLFCDHFHNVRVAAPNDTLISDLISGAIGAPGSAAPAFDPRVAFPNQTCRFLWTAEEPTTGAPKIAMTPKFTLVYPTATARVTSNVGLDFGRLRIGDGYRLIGAAFVNIQITNPNKAPLAFRFPEFVNEPMYIQYVAWIAGYAFRTANRLMTVSSSGQGFVRQWQHGADKVFELGPEATGTISVAFNNAAELPDDAYLPGEMPAHNYRMVAGIAYRFVNPVELRQLVSWDPEHPSLGGATIVRPEVQLAASETIAVFDGWIPGPGWIEVTGDGHRPFTAYNPARSPVFKN